jgi:hypothetical protein
VNGFVPGGTTWHEVPMNFERDIANTETVACQYLEADAAVCHVELQNRWFSSPGQPTVL